MAAHSRSTLIAFLAAGVILTSCKGAKITSYRVPKEFGPDAGEAPPPAVARALAWSAPANWTPGEDSPMRRGSFVVIGPEGVGDISIIAFRGEVGSDLDNVNRWRGQLQLSPVADVAGALRPFEVNGLHMLVFEEANHDARMIAVIVPRSGEKWFFKFTGPDALVARERPAFLDFLRTVKAP